MKKTIGQKIKEIREEKGMKQIAVLDNQGQLSQIENGKISNPDEGTIKMIAKNLDLPFDELIEGTDWSAPEQKAGQYVISPNSYDFKIEDNGYITYKNKAFPKYDGNGDLNEFCPITGSELIINCKNCKRQIEDINQFYCMGCGSKLVDKHPLPEDVVRLITPECLKDFGHCSVNLEEILKFQGDLGSWYEILEDCTSYEDWGGRMKGVVFATYRPPLLKKDTFENEKHKEIKYMEFQSHLLTAVERKLRKMLSLLESSEKNKSTKDIVYEKIYNTMENLIIQNISKIDAVSLTRGLFKGDEKDAFEKDNDKLIESNQKSIKMLADLLKSLDTDGDHSAIEEKLETIKSETQSSDEKISEDGNSETAAADKKAEPKKKNAKTKKEEK